MHGLLQQFSDIHPALLGDGQKDQCVLISVTAQMRCKSCLQLRFLPLEGWHWYFSCSNTVHVVLTPRFLTGNTLYRSPLPLFLLVICPSAFIPKLPHLWFLSPVNQPLCLNLTVNSRQALPSNTGWSPGKGSNRLRANMLLLLSCLYLFNNWGPFSPSITDLFMRTHLEVDRTWESWSSPCF